MWWTISAAVGPSSTCTPSCVKARAPIVSSRSTAPPAISARWYRTSSSRPSLVLAEGCRDERIRVGHADEGRAAVRPRIQLSTGVHCAGQRGWRAARHHRGDGQAGWNEDGCPGRLSGDRRSDLARGRVLPRRLEARRAAGQLRHQQPVLVDGGRQVLQLLGDGEAWRGDSQDGAAAAEGISRGRRSHRRVSPQPRRSRSIGTRSSITSAVRRSSNRIRAAAGNTSTR